MEKRNTEKIFVLVYSVYAVVLMSAGSILSWPAWINPVALAGILVVWVVYLREVRDYQFRALLYSAVALATFALYNTLESSFEGILTTYCAVVVALSILNVSEIVVPAYLFSTLLIVYHGIFRDTIPVATTHEKILSAAQIFAVFVVIGITNHLIKKREEKNRHMQEMIEELEAAEQSMLGFLAHISHEIRTPINNICGISGTVLQGDISDGVREDALRIQAEGKNLLSTINDVLELSELESGKTELVEEPYHLTSTIHDIINTAVAYQGSKDLELIVDCNAKIPSVLLGDEQKLRRVILCLVNNAVKFTKTGCITIAISARMEGYGVNLSVKVKDTGIGIAEEDLEKLFSGFNHIDEKGNRREGSIGIGLAISKRIISKMNGFISVKSELGKGSEFQIVVPQKVVDERPMAAVRNAEDINMICYINTEKASFTEIRDHYMSSLCHMMEGLEVQYHLCRNLGEFKRRCEKKIFTHALVGQDEYVEDRMYFDRLSQQMELLMIQDRWNPFEPEGNVKLIHEPFYVLSLAAVLNGGSDLRHGGSGNSQNNEPDVRHTCELAAEDHQTVEKKTHIDRDKGIRHMGGNPDHYEGILRVYLSEGQEKIPVIQEKYQAEDWENYVIYVHAVKSNSFGIGADELGEMAKALEAAGKEGDVSYIQEHHEEMMRVYGEVLSEISGGDYSQSAERRERT